MIVRQYFQHLHQQPSTEWRWAVLLFFPYFLFIGSLFDSLSHREDGFARLRASHGVSLQSMFDFSPQAYGLRPAINGFYHGLKTCSPQHIFAPVCFINANCFSSLHSSQTSSESINATRLDLACETPKFRVFETFKFFVTNFFYNS